MCIHAETCGQQLALEHNGDVYSCDHYVEPKYLLGNIKERRLLELVALPQQRKFGLDKRDTLTRFCRECDVRVVCNGGCPKDRFATSPYGEPGQHYLCPGYQSFFRHVREPLQAMVTLLRQDRAPAELMDELRRRGRPSAPQRTVHLRQRTQTETLPRRTRLRVTTPPDRTPAGDPGVCGAAARCGSTVAAPFSQVLPAAFRPLSEISKCSTSILVAVLNHRGSWAPFVTCERPVGRHHGFERREAASCSRVVVAQGAA